MNIYLVSWTDPKEGYPDSLGTILIAANSEQEAMKLALKENWVTFEEVKFTLDMLTINNLTKDVSKLNCNQILASYSNTSL
jgi:hypothetical protein